MRSDDSDDYRAVVDLEWSTGKINDNGKKRGWLIVCELISPFHDGASAEAGDNKALIREAYVVNERFFSCVKAAPDSKLAHSSLRRRPSLRAIEAAAVDLKIAQEAPITIRALKFLIKLLETPLLLLQYYGLPVIKKNERD